jgi:hypothetical protein
MSDRGEDRSTDSRVCVSDILRSTDEHIAPDVRERVRARVLSAVEATPPRTTSRRTYLVAAVLAAAFMLCTVGVGAAASGSLPGDVFYPVKRALERVRVIIAPAEGQSDVYVDMVDERIREIERLLNAGASARALNQAVDGFADAARGAVDVEVDEAAAKKRVEQILQHVDEAPSAVRDVIESALKDLDPPPVTPPPISDVPAGQPEGGVDSPVPDGCLPNEGQGEGGVEPMASPGAGESGFDADLR